MQQIVGVKEMDKAGIVFEKIAITQGKVFKSILNRLKITPNQDFGGDALKIVSKEVLKNKRIANTQYYTGENLIKMIQKKYPKK